MALSLLKKITGKKQAAAAPKKARGSAATPAASTPRSHVLAHRIQLMPLMSEKSLSRAQTNQVVFRVTAAATKGQIAAAIEAVYSTKPRSIRTLRMHPKNRQRAASRGRTVQWKKAYVTVDDVAAIPLSP